MTQLAILEYPDSRLRTTATAVVKFDDALRQLAADLLETMYAARGVGLAATQVDVHKRLLVVDVSETRDQPLVLVNPEIVSASGRAPAEEGCLSLPGIYDKVERATAIRVRALNDGRQTAHGNDGGRPLSAFERQGYFPGAEVSPLPPRLLLAAPALRIHPANEPVLRYFSPQVEWELIALTEHWRRELKVVFRKRGGDGQK